MTNRTRSILEDLEAVRETLLALSDEIWQSIEHNDPEALEEGVRFKRAYNEKIAAFDTLASELSAMIQQFTSVRLGGDEELREDDESQNARIIQALNREEPHSIDEDFTFKRPHGFILDGQGTTGVTTWRRVFERIREQIQRRDPNRFQQLPDHPNFISNRGHHSFKFDPEKLRSACLIADGLHAEINLSANGLRDVIRNLLATFEIPKDLLQLFLREDRDAGSESS